MAVIAYFDSCMSRS